MKVSFPFWIVLVAGLATFALKCKVTYSVQWIGNTDSAVFAETADSFVRGRGLSTDFIQYSYFYSPLQYPEINHPDAHYPPLYSLLTVPFYLVFGKTAFAAKLPAMASALCMIVFPNIFEHSLVPDDDGIYHFMVIASCFLIIMAIDTDSHLFPILSNSRWTEDFTEPKIVVLLFDCFYCYVALVPQKYYTL